MIKIIIEYIKGLVSTKSECYKIHSRYARTEDLLGEGKYYRVVKFKDIK